MARPTLLRVLSTNNRLVAFLWILSQCSFQLREVIRDNNPQEFITRYSTNAIKLNRCYNSGLILQKIDNHIFTFFLIKPHVTYGSLGVHICGDKWKVAWRTSRNRFKYRGVINVFHPISPFFDEKYMKRVSFPSKMVHKRVMGLDFQVSPSIVLTVDYMKEINSFMPILSIRIVLSRFYQLTFFFLESIYLNLTFTI